MKKIAGYILAASIMGFVSFEEFDCCNAIHDNGNQYQTYFEPALPNKGSLQEIYQDIIMTMLWQPINKAVDDFYEKNTGYSPKVDPWEPKVLKNILIQIS